MTLLAHSKVFRILCLDPVHVGTGQDIMGEVDLPIDREPETEVPRIPGPTLKGGFRSNTRWRLRMEGRRSSAVYCPGDKPLDEGEEATAAESCGIHNCAICQTFGWPAFRVNGKGTPGNEGRVFFRDGRVAFFPAATNHGTLWFSTPGRAAAYLEIDPASGGSETDPLYRAFPELAFGMGDFFAVSKEFSDRILVGWIKMEEIPHELPTKDSPLKRVVQKLKAPQEGPLFPVPAFWSTVAQRTILLDETTFYRVVETCLERRTCNKINEDTGTVEDQALFSYEALPRHTLLYARATWDTDGFPSRSDAFPYDSPLEICDLAREGLARMGIGGLQTRGLGSILVEPLT